MVTIHVMSELEYMDIQMTKRIDIICNIKYQYDFLLLISSLGHELSPLLAAV